MSENDFEKSVAERMKNRHKHKPVRLGILGNAEDVEHIKAALIAVGALPSPGQAKVVPIARSLRKLRPR